MPLPMPLLAPVTITDLPSHEFNMNYPCLTIAFHMVCSGGCQSATIGASGLTAEGANEAAVAGNRLSSRCTKLGPAWSEPRLTRGHAGSGEPNARSPGLLAVRRSSL